MREPSPEETAGFTVGSLTVTPLPGMPEVTAAHDLARLLRDALERAGVVLRDGDVLVVSSKVVSKALGLRSSTTDEYPAPDDAGGRDEIVLEQSTRVVAERATPSGTTRIVTSRSGPVLAAAGVDASNTGPHGGSLILPSDPDLAARTLYADLLTAYAPVPLPRIGVLLSDTAGRPWREGQVDFALGACGVEVLEDLRGRSDADGRMLSVTARAVADEIAAAADLVKGKRAAIPAVVVRGLAHAVTTPAAVGARALLRPASSDWFTLGTAESVRAALGAPPGSERAAAVGITSTGEEDLATRLRRCVDLALLEIDPPVDYAAVAVGDRVLEVSLEDPYRCGRAVARLEVALHSENLHDWRVERVTASAGVRAPTSEAPAVPD